MKQSSFALVLNIELIEACVVLKQLPASIRRDGLLLLLAVYALVEAKGREGESSKQSSK
jgi:hypothetical protein